MPEAEEQVLDFVKQHAEFRSAQLAGNSVHVDRMFIVKHMPKLTEYLHYRIIDVSTVMELARRWSPKVYRKAPKKKNTHTAMSDVKESLEELKYYQAHLFNKKR